MKDRALESVTDPAQLDAALEGAACEGLLMTKWPSCDSQLAKWRERTFPKVSGEQAPGKKFRLGELAVDQRRAPSGGG